jgi:isopentenyl diphosphate isomerase/L-lactate dehydrogenase-like FMN-dependent dehydrogenase
LERNGPTRRSKRKPWRSGTEDAGFKGVVVTLDTWITGWRPHDLSTANFPQLRGHCLANYFSDPVFRASLPHTPEDDPHAAVLRWAQVFGNPVSWHDLSWLRSLTTLPLLVKGICHPDDVRRAKDGGIDGIYCSNHGGTPSQRRPPTRPGDLARSGGGRRRSAGSIRTPV